MDPPVDQRELDVVQLENLFKGLRAFAQRDVNSSAVHDVAEDMALSLEALYIGGVDSVSIDETD